MDRRNSASCAQQHYSGKATLSLPLTVSLPLRSLREAPLYRDRERAALAWTEGSRRLGSRATALHRQLCSQPHPHSSPSWRARAGTRGRKKIRNILENTILNDVAHFHQRIENAFVFVNRFDCASCLPLLGTLPRIIEARNEHDYGRGRYSHYSQHRNPFGPCLGHVPLELMNLRDQRTLRKAAHAAANPAAGVERIKVG
jgi:hypothetical protein